MKGVAIITTAVSAASTSSSAASTSSAKLARRRLALALQRAGEERDEGGVERALREQAAEQVREAEGGVEGVGDRPGAERARRSSSRARSRGGGEASVAPPTLTNCRTRLTRRRSSVGRAASSSADRLRGAAA